MSSMGAATSKLCRSFLVPRVQIIVAHNGSQVDVITAHLKSKLLTFGNNFSTTNETLRAHTAFFALERRSAGAVGIRARVSATLAGGRDVNRPTRMRSGVPTTRASSCSEIDATVIRSRSPTSPVATC